MDQPRRRRTPRQLERLVKIIDEGAGALAKVDWAALAARVAETSEHDGYPSGSSEVAVMGGSTTTSTERAALAGLPGDSESDLRPDDWMRHYVVDNMAKAHDELCDLLVRVAALLGAAAHKVGFIEHVRDQKPDRQWQLAGCCRGCGRRVEGTAADPFRRGYCASCYDAWARRGCPVDEQRVAFDRQRWLAAHPTCTAADEHDWRRRQHTNEHGEVLGPVIPLEGEDRYRRHELPPAIDPDDVAGRTCEVCDRGDGGHYSWCSAARN